MEKRERESTTSSFTSPTSTADEGDGGQNLFRRLVGFLTLHVLALLADVATLIDFLYGANHQLMLFLSGPIILSGLVCTHAAWGAEPTQLQWPWGLPLKDQPLLLRAVLSIPLGFMQGVIILLAWDQYLERKNHHETGSQDKWNRYHCKAVASLCEGLPVFSTIIYAAWRMNYPPEKPVMSTSWPMEQYFLSTMALIEFFSCGFGIVELDFCCSKTVSKRMRTTKWYEFLHFYFRVSEFVVRTLLHVAFLVLTRWLVSWWWCPFVFGNLVFQFMVVLIHGGDESKTTVRLLCGLACAWVNIFFFVDSPYKRRAARKISFWFEARFFSELLLLPMLAYFVLWSHDRVDDLEKIVTLHLWIFQLMIFTILSYIILRIYMHYTLCRQMNLIDIYTPSEEGDKEKVQEVMDALVAEVRELTRAASADIDLNRPDVDGNTPLMLATRQGHAKVCELLVHRGAFVSITQQGNKGMRNWTSLAICRSWTALHMAAWHNHAKVIKVLVINGACTEDSQYLDTNGDTPLHIAARAGALEAAKVLIVHWPQWLLTLNAQNKRPQELAVLKGLQRMLAPGSSWFGTGTSGVEESQVGSFRPVLSTSRVSINQVWLSVPLHISRKRVHLVAPGICSYVAASCGGALGRLCLTTQQDQEEQEEEIVLSDLVPIDRMGNQVALPQAMIGEGAYGQVFRAKHRRRDVLYAVKVFKTPRDRPASPEVARECDVGTLIHQTPHPCIVRLYMVTFDEDSGHYTLVMEFCPSNLFQRVHSATLQNMAKGLTYKPPPQTLDWLGQVFLGLEHMHKRLNVLFRDLKPGNVILDSAQCAKLADFGAGRVGPSAGHYSFGHPAGTVGYCAPEVLGGMPHDERADFYSLGVLTWLLFTGGMPGSQPPVQPRPEVHQHLYDWLLLRKCLDDNFPPFQGVSASDLAQQAAEARDCVHLLVQPPEKRMRHSDLRAHALLEPLELPTYDAGPKQVESWLEERGFAKGQR